MDHADEGEIVQMSAGPAGGPPMTAPTPPTLSAYETAHGRRVWCAYCKRWHYHAAEPGHRAAHCHVVTSPYRATGYTLEPAVSE